MMNAEQMSVLTEKFLIQHGDQFVPMVVRVWIPSGTPRGSVFCFHEFEGNGRDFDQLAALLCTNGYQVICPDILGRGKSGYIGDPDSYTPDLFMQCLSALNKFGSKENYFIGVSWGATTLLISWTLASWKIAKLILVDPPLIGSPQVDEMRDRILCNANAKFETRSAAEMYIRQSQQNSPGVNLPALDELVKHRVLQEGDHYRLAFDPTTTDNLDKLREQPYDLLPVISQIDAPVLLFHSAETALIDQPSLDRYVGSRLDRWSSSLNCGSTSWSVHPDQAFLVLGFLSATSA